MKINKKAKKHAVKLWLVVIGLFIFTAATSAYLYWRHQSDQNKSKNSDTTKAIDYNPPTTEQKQAGETTKTTTTTTNTGTTKTPTISTVMSMSISATNVARDLLQIRAIIVGAVSNSGTCTLTLTSGDLTVTKTSSTYNLPSSSTCQGFDIKRSELTNGDWNINITAVIGTETAVATGKVTLE